jgi:predicted GH43/DUF377 family glycosyl hydrolase
MEEMRRTRDRHRSDIEPIAQRVSDVPLVAAGSVPGYGPIFNAGLLHHADRYHLFARGVRDGYRRNPEPGRPRFVDYISDVLVFVSADGRSFKFQRVLAAAGQHNVWCYEDPRLQWVRSNGSVELLMTYTDLPDPATNQPWRIGLHRLIYDGEGFCLNEDSGCVIGPPEVPDKDGVLFNLTDGRVALIHRVEPNMQLAVFESLRALIDADSAYWNAHLDNLEDHVILRPSPGALGVGAGAPPIESDAGLVLFYHERTGDGTYTVNVALLDPATGRVLAILPEPLLVPLLDWERMGDVDCVVFVQGAHRRADGTIFLTYGAADRAVGGAIVDEERLLKQLVV